MKFSVNKLSYRTIVRRKMNARSEEKFCLLVNGYDWNEMEAIVGVDKKTEFFHAVIEKMKDECFPLVRSRIRSDEDPWVNERVRAWIKKRNSIFQLQVRDVVWKSARDEVRNELKRARKFYYDREVEKIKNASNKRVLANTALKNLRGADRPKPWCITDLEPEKKEEYLVEELADFFNSVSSDHLPIDAALVPQTYDRPIFELTPEMIRDSVKSLKKPNSMVPGDVSPRLVNRVIDVLAFPIATIFNLVPLKLQWPELWKREYQTVIPKKASPSDFNELRNLSCTNFFSKILESFVVDSIKNEINISELQYGGMKGCGTDNFLVEVWNNILETLDQPGRCVLLMSVNFSKAFKRLSHQACLNWLSEKFASNQTIGMVLSFLENRSMCVRSGQVMSKLRQVMGGSPQGTKLGNLLFCISIDDITEPICVTPREIDASPEVAIPPENRPVGTSTPVARQLELLAADSFNPNPLGLRNKKMAINDTVSFCSLSESNYVDKDTWEIGYVDDLNVGETLLIEDSTIHLSTRKEKREIRAFGSEKMYRNIENNGADVGMMINAKKTQLLCIHPSKTAEITSCISVGSRKIVSGSSLKILGFEFGPEPSPRYHISKIIKKFYNSSWSIFHLKKAGMTEQVLLDVYRSMLRPIIEYGGNVVCSMLNEKENNELEGCQAFVMKLIYGFKLSYKQKLQKAGIERLATLRRRLFEKFCMKMSTSERISAKWLPRRSENEEEMTLRYKKKYIEFNAKYERLYKSPVFEMRRYLNSLTNI